MVVSSPSEPGPLHRLERRGTAAQHPLPRLQHAVSDSAVGRGPAPGVAHPGTHGPPDLAGLEAQLRTPDLFAGNLHRSGTIPRDLLSSGELGGAGTNTRSWQKRSEIGRAHV